MAYSPVTIERQKSHLINLQIISLIILHFSLAWFCWMAIKNFALYYAQQDQWQGVVLTSPIENLSLLGFALVVALLQMVGTLNLMADRILGLLGAEPLRSNDPYHKKLQNVIEEACIAVGGAKIGGCVINSSAVNAFSVSDLQRRSYIGVTEGALARLSRSQLEAVVGYQVTSIMSGDSFSISLTGSVFGVYENFFSRSLDDLSKAIAVKGPSRISINISKFFAGIFLFSAKLLNGFGSLFVGRERTFKIDAMTVKLTRNPLALAQSLYLISKTCHRAAIRMTGLSALFIADPQESALGVRSTYPSIKKRIDLLLKMAYTDQSALEGMLKDTRSLVKSAPLKKGIDLMDKKGWFVLEAGQWQGPFLFTDLVKLNWLRPDHLIRRDGSLGIKKVCEDDDLKNIFKPVSQSPTYKYTCPHCYHGLEEVFYEGGKAYKCVLCKGVFVDSFALKRILIRKEQSFNGSIVKQARLVKAQRKEIFKRIQDIKTPYIISCPKCNKKMRRRLFSYYAPVEIDVCIWCDLYWFDRSELEVIQVLYDEHPHKDEIIG